MFVLCKWCVKSYCIFPLTFPMPLVFSFSGSELQNAIAQSILHGFPWKLNCRFLHMQSKCVCTIKLYNITLFLFHVFGTQRAISKVKQLYQLEYATNYSKTWAAPSIGWYSGAQNQLCTWDDNLIYGDCCIAPTLTLGCPQGNSCHKSDCDSRYTINFEHLNTIQ